MYTRMNLTGNKRSVATSFMLLNTLLYTIYDFGFGVCTICDKFEQSDEISICVPDFKPNDICLLLLQSGVEVFQFILLENNN